MMRARLLLTTVCLMASQALGAENPTASELLDKYKATQDKLQRFIIKSESHFRW